MADCPPGEANSLIPQSTTTPAEPPPVLFWFKIYCGVLCVLYLAVMATALIFFFIGPEHLDMPAIFGNLMGALYLLLGLVLFAACFLPFVLQPRPWVWTYDLVIIALGLSSPCLLPASIPLIIFWVKPEMQRYFGRPG
jgi:hypothetical protein